MTDRDALRRVAEALPAGAAVSVPREWLLELLTDGSGADAPELTVPELAAMFQRSDSTMRARLERGDFPGAYKFGGKQWRIPRAAIAAFREAEARRGEAVVAPASLGDWRGAPTGGASPIGR